MLTAEEVEQVNLALSRGEISADVTAEWTAIQEKEKAAQEQMQAARRAAIEAQAAALTDAELQAARLTVEYLRQDAALTDVVDISLDDYVDGIPCHALLLKSADDEFLAYSYDTKTVYCPSSDEIRRGTEDYSTEENRCLALLSAFAYHVSGSVDNYWGPDETRIELTPSEIEEVNLVLSRGKIPEDAEEEAEITIGERAAQLAAEYLGEDITLTDVVDFAVDDFVYGIPCHVLLLKSADDEFLAYGYDTEKVYCPSSDEVWNYQSDAWTTDWSAEENRCLYLLLVLANHASGENDIYVSSEETRTELTAAEVKQVNLVLRQGSITEEVKAAQDEWRAARQAAIGAQAAQLAAEHFGEDAVLTNVEDVSLDNFGGAPCHVLLLKDENDRFLAYDYNSEAVYCPASSEVRSFINFNESSVFSTEKTQYTYLLRQFSNHIGVYWDDEETRTELTAEEIDQANWVLAGEDVPSAVDDAALAALEMKAAQLTVAAIKAQAGQMDSEYLNPDTILPEGSGAYKVLDECPEEFSRRELSDEEIQSLAQGDLERARERISTGGDFAAWLVAMGGRLRSGLARTGDEQRVIGAPFAYDRVHEMLDSTMAAALAVRVLGDDLPGISIVAAQATTMGGTFLCGNLIPADGGYYLISFDALTDEWKDAVEAGQITPEAFPAIWADGTAGITAWCRSTDNPRGNVLVQAFYFPGEQEIVLDHEGELYIPQDPWKGQEFFRDEALAEELVKQKAAHIKPENIGHYDLSTKLGGTTLTPEEAYALLDMEPEQVKERVKTAADVLMLMLAGQYSDCHGDRNITIDGNIWHYNLNAFQVMETRTTNCGSAANLANYLLEGDYEEIGFILHAYYIGDGGGHVYNYFKYQGKYYIVDFSSYMFGNYQPEQDFPVMELDRLEDYGSRIPELYGNVCMALAHTSPGQHYPNVFDDQNKAYAIPAGVEYTLLYQETGSNCYILKEYPLDKSQLDWTTFGEP